MVMMFVYIVVEVKFILMGNIIQTKTNELNVSIGTEGIDKKYTRLTFVCYLRTKLINCDIGKIFGPGAPHFLLIDTILYTLINKHCNDVCVYCTDGKKLILMGNM